MEEQALIDYLKANLKIRGSSDSGGGNYGYDSASITIEILLGDEVICSDTF